VTNTTGNQPPNSSIKFFFAIFLVFVGLLPRAHAHIPEEGMVWATVGPLVNRTFESPQGPGEIAKYYNGFGLMVEGDTSKHGGIELGLFHLERQYHLKYKGDFLVQRVNRIHAPIGYRWWHGDKFSTMLGIYSSYRMGDVVEVVRPASIDKSVETSAEEDLCEYGLDFSLQWELLRIDRYAGVLDWRYSYVLSENAHESSDHFTLLVGLKYLIQSKTIAPE
jgi:hypothetical protein